MWVGRDKRESRKWVDDRFCLFDSMRSSRSCATRVSAIRVQRDFSQSPAFEPNVASALSKARDVLGFSNVPLGPDVACLLARRSSDAPATMLVACSSGVCWVPLDGKVWSVAVCGKKITHLASRARRRLEGE